MNDSDAETILVMITCLVGIACGIAVANKRGITLGSVSSMLKVSARKYVVRDGQRKRFYLYLGLVSLIALSVALMFTRDPKSIAFFMGFNMLSIGYFLTYFVLLEPKDKSV